MLPHIYLRFNFNNQSYELLTNENKWYIDNCQYSNKDEYFKRLSNILAIDNVEDLFVRCNPSLLVNVILSDGEDKKFLKDEFIQIINSGLDINNKISNLNEIITNKNTLQEEIKILKKELKNVKKENENYKKHHNDITNWDDLSNTDDKSQLLFEIEDKINNYEKISNEIKVKNEEINKLNIEWTKINSESSLQKTKWKWWQWILIFLTFGLYYFFRKKKQSASRQYNNLGSNNEYHKKKIDFKINDIKKEINSLSEDKNYKDIMYDSLLSQREELRKNQIYNKDFDFYKAQYQQKYNNQKELENKCEEKEKELNELKNQYNEISMKIENIIKHKFNGLFEVSFFDEKGNDKLLIKQNNIDLKYLNHANKMNLIHLLNHFIKKSININCFNLIDHAESFNNLLITSEDTQVIACYVSTNKSLGLNGKNIN